MSAVNDNGGILGVVPNLVAMEIRAIVGSGRDVFALERWGEGQAAGEKAGE